MFRVLSIDGGGVRGVYPAALLAQFEQQLAQPIHRFFDLIVGTSTGGILAIGLALGIPARELEGLYRERASAVFPQSYLGGARRWMTGRKYATGPLEDELRRAFGDAQLGAAKTRLCIPAVDCATGSPRVFKTRHSERFHVDAKLPAYRVALATAAAPTYFPAVPVTGPDAMVDGGLWANNPTMVGIVEATSVLRVPPSSLRVLSIGTGSKACVISASEATRPNATTWPMRIVDFVLAAQAQAAEFQSSILAREMGFVYRRLNPELKQPRLLDDIGSIAELLAYADRDARTHLHDLRLDFFDTAAAPFVPIPLPEGGAE